MAKSMTERYEEYLNTDNLIDRAAKNIYYWAMSTLESNFWGLEHTPAFDINLYASEEKIFFVFYILGKSSSIDDRLDVEDNNAKLRFSKQLIAQKILVPFFYTPKGKEYKFVYYSIHNCQNGKLPKMLEKFTEIFNNTVYPLSEQISSPIYQAYYYNKRLDNGKYKGYYKIYIHVDMLPKY